MEGKWTMLFAVLTLAQREWVRFFRQRQRVLAALIQPVLFWFLFDAGLSGSFRAPGAAYGSYLFPGTVVLVILFAAIFSTLSIIEDRREGFLQSVLVAPVPRSVLVSGKVLGGALLAAAQGLLLLALAPIAGIGCDWARLPEIALFLFSVSLGLTALGFLIAWRMDSTQGFHAIMMIFLMPMWLLSGAFFPVTGATPAWLRWTVRCNPLGYGVAGLRRLLGTGAMDLPSLPSCWGVVLGFAAILFAVDCSLARRTGRKDWTA